MNRPPGAIYLAGPTASGKSALAMLLAKEWQGEIVSVDSMQVYRGMDVGTGKPDADDRRAVTHHLLDVADPTAAFDTMQYVQLATEARHEIVARGKLPIFCGGTGLYFKALLFGVGTGPKSNPSLRAELESRPLPELLRELEERDPVAFATVDKQNPRRVIRAVEVIRLTGRPFSEQRSSWKDSRTTGGVRILCLERESAELRQRIHDRVDWMFANGLVEETRRLLELGVDENATSMQALGYRQVVDYLRNREKLDAVIGLVKTRTWQFAKRQMTWFRHQLPVEWVKVAPGVSPEAIAMEVRSRLLDSNSTHSQSPALQP